MQPSASSDDISSQNKTSERTDPRQRDPGLRLGVSSGAFYPGVPTEEVPTRAAALGVRDVELMLQTPGEYELGFIARVGEAVRAHGVNVHVLHTFQALHPVLTPYPRRTDEAMALFDAAIEAAAALGARAILWHGPRRDELRGDDAWDRLLPVIDDLAGRCQAAGIALAIENVSWCVVSTVRDVLYLNARLAELPHGAAVGYAFDPFQAAEAGANPLMVLAAMEGRLLDVHLSDLREEDRTTRHLLPGDGDLPWPALIRAVAASGYRGPLMIEGALGEGSAALDRVRSLLDPLLREVASETDPCSGQLPPGVLEGIALFNRGEFYECHEVIEHEWHAERRPIRRLYQGILQISVGFHHARGGNHRGALLLLTDGIAKVREFLPHCAGVDTQALADAAQSCLDAIAALGTDRLSELDWSLVPMIEVGETDKRTDGT